nr:MAG TPA: hypothetical protein [Caudoviricetes sp.]
MLICNSQLKLSFQDAQNRSLAVFRVPGRNVVRWSSKPVEGLELFAFELLLSWCRITNAYCVICLKR